MPSFSIKIDDAVEATGTAPTREECIQEAMHYALQYVGDLWKKSFVLTIKDGRKDHE